MLKWLWHILAFGFVIFAIVATSKKGTKKDTYPDRPIKIVVPYAAGGGSDTFVRIIQKAIQDNDLLPQPLVVVNKPGGSATIGSRSVKDAKPDGYTILNLHEAIITAKYTGQATYGPEAFEAIAATGETGQVIMVKNESRFKTLKDFVEAAEKEKQTVTFGINFNTPSHFSGIMLENESNGAEFRFVSTGGASKRYAALKGDHIEAAVFSISEYVQFKANGMRALAYLGEKRHAGASDVPTAKELGYNVVNTNMQYWWFPKGTPQDKIKFFADVLRKACATDYAQKKFKELQIEPKYYFGEELNKYINSRSEIISKTSVVKRVKLPDVKVMVFFVIILLASIALYQNRNTEKPIVEKKMKRNDLAVYSIGLTVAYALVLSLSLLSFRPATLIYVLAVGFTLLKNDKSKYIYILQTSLLMSFGVFYIFTQIFTVDMP